ncbi:MULTISPECIES: DUF1203 domain-containing protein [unclassified Dyella]|uniref:DUF1203 domain-containing protein n=1 Tax=unclassified Dyella TaxID=2634549 RepID=UPI000C850B7F|nr:MULTISPECIES: DUF1203 domain-containing protein [unclassified Dyella]MDR3445907.1 DUF1203 domain-containing protein [Dyella sp.]PMQ02848.1 hypothetical protein DyAD56_22215 [Dyella sp. AD56]
MHFRLSGLPAEPFAELFALPDEALAERRAMRVTADRAHGYPCRISLTDAEPGQSLILLNYEHQPANSPFRSNHAIYIREGEAQYDRVDEVPDQLRRRLLSVRGFDEHGMLRDADVVQGTALEPLIERLFADDSVAHLHIHIARPGCYAARVDRV